jgi:hypothetical protein
MGIFALDIWVILCLYIQWADRPGITFAGNRACQNPGSEGSYESIAARRGRGGKVTYPLKLRRCVL